MKKSVYLSDGAKLFLFALLSFLVFLLFYALLLGLEAALGAGQAFLWFLIVVPIPFVVYQVVIGALCYNATDRALLTVLFQFLAALLADVIVVAVNLLSTRNPITEDLGDLWWFDLGLLIVEPLLCFCGVRIVKIIRTVKAMRALKEENTSSDKEEV